MVDIMKSPLLTLTGNAKINTLRMSLKIYIIFIFKELKSMNLSYDVAVIQWITSCHKKSYDHTLHNTSLLARNVMMPSVTTLYCLLK